MLVSQTMKNKERDTSKSSSKRGGYFDMRGKALKFLQYIQNNRLFISKWSAITAIILAVIVSAMSLSIRGMSYGVKLSLLPVLLAAAAWSIANAAKAPKKKLFAILALWISLGGVFISHLQYQRLLAGLEVQKQTVQNEQK